MATPKKLEDYPRPGVAVDLAVLTVRGAPDEPELCVLLQEQAGQALPALPGRFIRERETVDQTVKALLVEKVGITLPRGKEPRLLEIFDSPDRDQRSWVISVAKVVALREELTAAVRGEFVPVGPLLLREGDAYAPRGAVERKLAYDHDEIVNHAVQALREQYEIRKKYLDVGPDPEGFAAPPWTLAQLRKVHEAVLGAPLQKDAFARRMEGKVEPVLNKDGTPKMHVGIGRPAQLQQPRQR